MSDDLDDLDLTPVEYLDISREAIPSGGRVVAALPCTNPSLSPTINITAHGELGYYLTIADAFGTRMWELTLRGREDKPT